MDNTDDVLDQSYRTFRRIVDMETDERGYLVSGDRNFIDPYEDAEAQVWPALRDLERAVAGDPVQLEQARAVRNAFSRWSANSDYEIALRSRPDGYQAATVYFKKGKGRALKDELSRQLNAFTRREQMLRERAADGAQLQALITLSFGGPVTLVGGALLSVFTRRQMHFLSEQYERALEAEADARERLAANLTAAAEKQTRIAVALQQSLLLTAPEDVLAGIRLATRYEAAQEEAELGGDFYDAFPIDESTVALIVGDVTGKGLEAAIFTAEVKFSLRAILREHRSPAQALAHLNRFLLDAHRLEARSRNVLVSIAVAVLDTRTGDLACSLGGAECALLLRAESGRVEEIGAAGPLLGADVGDEGIGYEESRTVLLPGDLLLLVTDGVTEARRGSEFFGLEGVARVAEEHARSGGGSAIGPAPPAELVDGVLAAAREFAGGKLRDDACLLAARRT